jgi:hypothetical protein
MRFELAGDASTCSQIAAGPMSACRAAAAGSARSRSARVSDQLL